mgnify:CR=1 FL=1
MDPEVYNLENDLTQFVGSDYAITCSSGTDALLMALMSLGVKNGDYVVTTPFTYIATAEVISLLGGVPEFVDIDESTFNINPQLLELEINKVIKDEKLNPRAIISVDLFGLLADYNEIERISRKFNLFLIEDAAQSFGATYNNKKACSFGNASATSFYPAKPLGCYGDGGAVFTDDDDLADICKSIRVHGEGKDKYDNIHVGLNSRLDTIQASVLLNKMKIFDEELKLRNLVAKEYSKRIPENVKAPYIPNGFSSSWAQYSILFSNQDERNDIIDLLNKEDIPTSVFYRVPFNKNKVYSSKVLNSFPVSEKISESILSLPMHPYLSSDEINKITSLISNYYK